MHGPDKKAIMQAAHMRVNLGYDYSDISEKLGYAEETIRKWQYNQKDHWQAGLMYESSDEIEARIHSKIADKTDAELIDFCFREALNQLAVALADPRLTVSERLKAINQGLRLKKILISESGESLASAVSLDIRDLSTEEIVASLQGRQLEM